MTVVEKAPDVGEFRRLRQIEFPWTADVLYLNSAAIGPLPERTRHYLDEFSFKRAAPHRLDDDDLMAQLQVTRETVARLINADASEIALAFNTTFGINVAARALPLQKGDTVVVSDREFPANVYPWLELRQRGVNVEVIPTLTNGWPDEERLMDCTNRPDVRALTVSLVQFSNGYRADVARLGAACRAAGCFFVVDGIQGIGQVPFDVRETPVDILACGAQKWLLSPWGSGFVYVNKELLNRLAPPVVGWMAFEGTEDVSHLTDYSGSLRSNARRFEVNTLPFQDLIAMCHSVELLLELGIESVREWVREIRVPLLEGAKEGGYEITSPTSPEHESAITCVSTPDTELTWRRLAEKQIVCALREGVVRISPHCFNTPDEMERVVEILSDQT